jgi:hypothetical protein
MMLRGRRIAFILSFFSIPTLPFIDGAGSESHLAEVERMFLWLSRANQFPTLAD